MHASLTSEPARHAENFHPSSSFTLAWLFWPDWIETLTHRIATDYQHHAPLNIRLVLLVLAAWPGSPFAQSAGSSTADRWWVIPLGFQRERTRTLVLSIIQEPSHPLPSQKTHRGLTGRAQGVTWKGEGRQHIRKHAPPLTTYHPGKEESTFPNLPTFFFSPPPITQQHTTHTQHSPVQPPKDSKLCLLPLLYNNPAACASSMMSILRAATTFNFKDFTLKATTWLTISFRPFLHQAFFFVFNSVFPIMFRPGKRASPSSSSAPTSSVTSAAGGSSSEMVQHQRPRSSAGPARRTRKPKPQGPWPRDAGGQ